MPIETGFAAVNGTRLYYETAGSGPPLVLIHGHTLDTRMWDDQFAPFAAQYRVIRYDLRGYGRSDLPSAEPYDPAADLHALLALLNAPSAHIIGLSMGGGVAIDYALAYPEATLSLIAVDSALGGHRFSEEFLATLALPTQVAADAGVAAAREIWLEDPLFVPARRNPDVASRLEAIIEAYSGWHWQNRNPARTPGGPAAQRLGTISAPALVVLGVLDVPDFHRIAETLAREIPAARQATLPKAGHMSNMEAPDAFNQVVLDFLNSLPKPV